MLPVHTSVRLVLVRACTIDSEENGSDPLNCIGRPGRQREYAEECTLIGRVHHDEKNEGDYAGRRRVFLFELREDLRENLGNKIEFEHSALFYLL
jgi:hypothetical protein